MYACMNCTCVTYMYTRHVVEHQAESLHVAVDYKLQNIVTTHKQFSYQNNYLPV